jgi:hypothetical protein
MGAENDPVMKILRWRGPCRIDPTGDTQEPVKGCTATVEEAAVSMYALRTLYPYIVLPQPPTGENLLDQIPRKNGKIRERIPTGVDPSTEAPDFLCITAEIAQSS